MGRGTVPTVGGKRVYSSARALTQARRGYKGHEVVNRLSSAKDPEEVCGPGDVISKKAGVVVQLLGL